MEGASSSKKMSGKTYAQPPPKSYSPARWGYGYDARGRIMPVRVIKRKEKWRLVEPDGKIAKTPKGTARDGGGHTDQAKAKSQARAINRSLSKAGKI